MNDYDGVKFEEVNAPSAHSLKLLREENKMNTLSNNAESYTPTKDKTETLEDGRTIQIAVKGSPMPMADAVRLGLVDDPNTEKKSETPTANKTAAPSENKSKK